MKFQSSYKKLAGNKSRTIYVVLSANKLLFCRDVENYLKTTINKLIAIPFQTNCI